jgi:hypothetical protein
MTGAICIIFDVSNIDGDITILKYFLQVQTPHLFWVVFAYIS